MPTKLSKEFIVPPRVWGFLSCTFMVGLSLAALFEHQVQRAMKDSGEWYIYEPPPSSRDPKHNQVRDFPKRDEEPGPTSD